MKIFRILAFEYRQADAIDIEIIAEMVSTIFYPFENPPIIRANFKRDILKAFEPYLDENKKITEAKFCEVMSKIDRYIRQDNYERFVYKIFKRHDKDKNELLSKEGNLLSNPQEFTILMHNFKDPNLTETDINEIYLRMMGQSESGDGIDFKSFFKNSLFQNN